MKTKKSKKRKPYVFYDTIWKGVGGGLSNPGEQRICKVGKYNVLLKRSERLNYYGNPIHTVTLIKPDGSMGYSVRGSGSATTLAAATLSKNGIETKRKKNKIRR